MALAVEETSIVLIAASTKYDDSVNCRCMTCAKKVYEYVGGGGHLTRYTPIWIMLIKMWSFMGRTLVNFGLLQRNNDTRTCSRYWVSTYHVGSM